MATDTTGTEIEVREKQALDPTQGESTWQGPMYRPDVDIYSTKERIVLYCDMPGVERDQLDIDLRDGVLTILGRVGPMPEGFTALSEEYGVGGFVRRFTLSDDIDADGIEAILKDGVLQLVLPRAKATLPRKIDVQIA